MTKYIMFDVDNTLYSSNNGLEEEAMGRIEDFIVDLLHMKPEEVWEERRRTSKKYGTFLEWLMSEKGFTDVEAYMAAVHPKDEAENLPADPELRSFLEHIEIPKAILTNAPMEHVDRILGKLEIPHSLFNHIFEIRQFNFRGKPHRDVYEKVINILGADAADVIFIDDYPLYAAGFVEIGGKGLLLDEKNIHTNYPYPRIRNLKELVQHI